MVFIVIIGVKKIGTNESGTSPKAKCYYMDSEVTDSNAISFVR